MFLNAVLEKNSSGYIRHNLPSGTQAEKHTQKLLAQNIYTMTTFRICDMYRTWKSGCLNAQDSIIRSQIYHSVEPNLNVNLL